MNAPERALLPDIQSLRDCRGVAIDQAGIRGLRYPVTVVAGQPSAIATVATVDMSVGLAATARGTHMSRFLEVLGAHAARIGTATLPDVLRDMLDHLEAEKGALCLRFEYFIMKVAPVSGASSLMDYGVCLRAEGGKNECAISVEVVVPVTSLCPCSKEISVYGAHNQRSAVKILATLFSPIEPDDLIAMAERAASCELYGVLKRVDEKYVTERAYDNPKFVEDMVRDVALELERDIRICSYRVEIENYESIHNHSAFAVIERDKRGA
jgi:GTP cyclohydrolase IB